MNERIVVVYDIPDQCFDCGKQIVENISGVKFLPSTGDIIWVDHKNNGPRNRYRVTGKQWKFNENTLIQIWIMVEPLTGYFAGEYRNLND